MNFAQKYLQFIRFKFFVGVGHESTHVFNNFGRSDGDMIK